jgi:hypothetical protein
MLPSLSPFSSSTSVADDVLLDAAIAMADHERSTAVAAVAEADLSAIYAAQTELEPLHIEADEYLWSEDVAVCLVSAYDKMPASELSSIPDATAKQIGLSEALRSQHSQRQDCSHHQGRDR